MYRIVKRGLDIVISLVGLVVLLPVFAMLILLIRLDSPGNALFKQKRVGKDQALFEIIKLRTMNSSAPHDVATAMLDNPDAHITRVGRILRKTSLDELPQLINVLVGDMSLIGPRPLVPGEKDIHEARAERGAYGVRPGITGWAQVNGRDCVDPVTKAELDGFYAKNVSLFLDLKIIVFSVFCVLTARGVREGATAFDEEVDERKKIPQQKEQTETKAS